MVAMVVAMVVVVVVVVVVSACVLVASCERGGYERGARIRKANCNSFARQLCKRQIFL